MITNRRPMMIAGIIGGAVLVAGLVFLMLPRRASRPISVAPSQSADVPPAPQDRTIKARLFYVAEDGRRLTTVEHDVRFAERPVDQARELLEAQLQPVDEPVVSAIPAGTKLRALFLTKEGEAFVDLSGEVSSAHGGGALDELLTVYTIVHVLTANMPAIVAVQMLVDGKEVDTLAGHVDLRQPLVKNSAWVQ